MISNVNIFLELMPLSPWKTNDKTKFQVSNPPVVNSSVFLAFHSDKALAALVHRSRASSAPSIDGAGVVQRNRLIPLC